MREVCGGDLDDGTELLGEQRGEGIRRDARGIELGSESGGEQHLEHCDIEATVGAIVIRGELALGDKFLIAS